MGAAAVPAALTAGSAAFSAYSQVQQGKMQANYFDYLSKTSDINAGLAKAQGDAAVTAIGYDESVKDAALNRNIQQTIGEQKAAIASQGGGLNSRTSEDIINDTLDKGALDEMVLRKNADIATRNARAGADISSLNYMTQSEGYKISGANAITASRYGAIGSLLGGAGSVANSWYQGQ